MTSIRNLTALVVGLVLCNQSIAQTLSVQAFWAGDNILSYDKPLESSIQIEVVIQLKNTGKDRLTVFCRKQRLDLLATNHSDSTFDALAVYRVSFVTGQSGDRIIPSLFELAPVVLEPGEVTEFRCPMRVPPRETLEKIKLTYWIDEDIGRRFDAWFGTTEAPILRQRMVHAPRK